MGPLSVKKLGISPYAGQLPSAEVGAEVKRNGSTGLGQARKVGSAAPWENATCSCNLLKPVRRTPCLFFKFLESGTKSNT